MGRQARRHRADHPYGARSGNDKDAAKATCRPSAATACSSPTQISTVADYVRSLSGLPTEPGADLAAGKKVFADNCAVCHGPDGKGNRELGSANLTDKIWLYGSDKETIVQTITNGRGGVMPAWGGPPVRADHQGAGRLRLHLRRRREVTVPAAPIVTLDRGAKAPDLARLVAAAEQVGGAPPPDDDVPLYAPRRKIYPQSVQGTFRRIKWAVLIVTLGIYYCCPSCAGTAGRRARARRC